MMDSRTESLVVEAPAAAAPNPAKFVAAGRCLLAEWRIRGPKAAAEATGREVGRGTVE